MQISHEYLVYKRSIRKYKFLEEDQRTGDILEVLGMKEMTEEMKKVKEN